ncbi:MAG: RsmB/NOP family class I SAM-dependent RNA methyltransferase [Candidatus Thalassarchaeum sp.]
MGSEVPWSELARDSILLKAVSHWRDDADAWFEGSFERLPETVRVNPLRADRDWTESWLLGIGSVRIPWFTGPGSAWTLPFERGAAEGETRETLKALHETGRLTRQEAVSMLPVLALSAKPGDIVLDMCASPGSKTTQIAECLGDSGLVLGNEVVNSRVNMLVSNSHRHGSQSIAVVNHDGRHMPKVPESGFDRVLVDAPCTGSGTTRKNPDVWGKWLPSGGRSLHDLQVDLLSRAVAVTRSGGRIVYATCSLDPVEDEAVVAEVLRSHNDLELLDVSELLPDVSGEVGRSAWPVLGDDGHPSDEAFSESMASPEKSRFPPYFLDACVFGTIK